MTVLQTTPHLGLPLPHPDNDLEQDVVRLRQSLSAIDHKFDSLDQLLFSDDATLDQVQELVNAIKANRTTINDLLLGTASLTDVTALGRRVDGIETNLFIDLY